jgi:nicotinate-nucleotide adenylyltransferase
MSKNKTRTGLFGGSFNPIHLGHLALADYLCEQGELDEVWFLVSPHNPLKEERDLLDDHLRLEMVRLAIDGHPRFHASDFEFHLPRPSYMVHTLDALKAHYPEREFTLLIGSDNWQLFPRWYDYERLLRENHLLIYPRPGYEVHPADLPANVRLVQAPLLDISSTQIREALQQGRDTRHLLPKQVEEYIREHQLYKEP